MKTLVFSILIFLTINVHSQKKEFIRVYILEGKKIMRGRDYQITDSTIEFKKKNKIRKNYIERITKLSKT